MFFISSEGPPCSSTPRPCDGEFKCRSTGKFPHPTDCHKFYLCWGEIQGNLTCGPDQVFDKTLLRCSDDWSVCKKTPQCKRNKQSLPDPEDDQKYFICIRSRNWRRLSAYHRSCKQGQVFSPRKQRCSDSHDEVGNVSTEDGSDSSEECSSENNFICKADGTFADPKDKRRYYICNKNCDGTFRKRHNTCSNGKTFNSKLLACTEK